MPDHSHLCSCISPKYSVVHTIVCLSLDLHYFRAFRGLHYGLISDDSTQQSSLPPTDQVHRAHVRSAVLPWRDTRIK